MERTATSFTALCTTICMLRSTRATRAVRFRVRSEIPGSYGGPSRKWNRDAEMRMPRLSRNVRVRILCSSGPQRSSAFSKRADYGFAPHPRVFLARGSQRASDHEALPSPWNSLHLLAPAGQGLSSGGFRFHVFFAPGTVPGFAERTTVGIGRVCKSHDPAERGGDPERGEAERVESGGGRTRAGSLPEPISRRRCRCCCQRR